MMDTYPESTTKPIEPFPVFACTCGNKKWAVAKDKPVYCEKCGARMELEESKEELSVK